MNSKAYLSSLVSLLLVCFLLSVTVAERVEANYEDYVNPYTPSGFFFVFNRSTLAWDLCWQADGVRAGNCMPWDNLVKGWIEVLVEQDKSSI